MNERSRRERLKWLLEEREALPVRRDLQNLLRIVAIETQDECELVGRYPGDKDPLTMRVSKDPFVRFPLEPLDEALERLLHLLAIYPTGPWLIKPIRPERIGLIRSMKPPNGNLLNALAAWDGEGLILGPELEPGWLLLDIEGRGSSACGEVLMFHTEVG